MVKLHAGTSERTHATADPAPLTVLAIADTVSPVLYDHFQQERWKSVDVVLSAGDLPPDYLDFLCTALAVPVFYVRGNHDGSYAADRYAGAENLHGRIVAYRGVTFTGFEGCQRYNHGSYQYTERQMRRRVFRTRLQSVRKGRADVIFTHAAPAGCHDAPDPCHQGFECFQTLIDAWKPAYLVHGHVHAYNPGPKRTAVGDTIVLNAFPYQVFSVQPKTLPSSVALQEHPTLHLPS